jgi:hypothetical protein
VLADLSTPKVPHVEQRPADWTLLRVSPTGRTVVVGAVGGGCVGKPVVSVASQDDAAVTLAATQSEVVPDGPDDQVACTMDLRFYRVGVTLDRPLAGRALRTQARVRAWAPTLSGRPPRLAGTRARDAVLALRNQGFRPHLAGPIEGTVVRVTWSFARANGTDVTVVARPR